MERLQKIIAQVGIASRRAAEELIEQGKVTVNGEIAKLGDKADFAHDVIKVNGKQINIKEPHVYFLLNKPRQTLSSVTDDRERKTVIDLIPTKYRIFPVGRLDYDTTGALLLTNDGELTNILTHPSNKIEKTYIVITRGKVIPRLLEKLEDGVIIDGNYKTAPAKARLVSYDKETDKSKVRLTITEGRNRQVKKMFEAIGFRVGKLHREAFGDFIVKGIQSGEYIEIKEDHIKYLKRRK